jgi:hypothetical protein
MGFGSNGFGDSVVVCDKGRSPKILGEGQPKKKKSIL